MVLGLVKRSDSSRTNSRWWIMALIYFLMRFSWRIMMSPVSRVILWLSAFFLCLSNILLVGEWELLNCDVWFLIHFLLWNQRNMEVVLQVIYFQIIIYFSSKVSNCSQIHKLVILQKEAMKFWLSIIKEKIHCW